MILIVVHLPVMTSCLLWSTAHSPGFNTAEIIGVSPPLPITWLLAWRYHHLSHDFHVMSYVCSSVVSYSFKGPEVAPRSRKASILNMLTDFGGQTCPFWRVSCRAEFWLIRSLSYPTWITKNQDSTKIRPSRVSELEPQSQNISPPPAQISCFLIQNWHLAHVLCSL